MEENSVFEERRENVDRSCPIVDSDLCDWLAGRSGCERCYIHSLKSDEAKEEAKVRWFETISMIPRRIDSLHESDTCAFCKDEPRNADGYAMFEMANPEPYAEKGMFFGIGKKVRTPIGSLVTLQASVCPRCRKVFRSTDLIQIGSIVAAILIAVIILFTPIGEKMNIYPLIPVAFLALVIVAGYFIGKNAYLSYLKRKAKVVRIDMAEIPLVGEMLSRGWFFFQTNNGLPRLSFSKKPSYDRILGKSADADAGEAFVEEEKEGFNPLDNMNI